MLDSVNIADLMNSYTNIRDVSKICSKRDNSVSTMERSPCAC